MSQITIRGSSDDLIEIEGDIIEEFNHYSDEGAFLFVSDGSNQTIAVYNVCKTCEACDGRAGMLINDECENCYDTRRRGEVVVHGKLPRTEDELNRTFRILDRTEYDEHTYNSAIKSLSEQLLAMARADADDPDDPAELVELAGEYFGDATTEIHRVVSNLSGFNLMKVGR